MLLEPALRRAGCATRNTLFYPRRRKLSTGTSFFFQTRLVRLLNLSLDMEG